MFKGWQISNKRNNEGLGNFHSWMGGLNVRECDLNHSSHAPHTLHSSIPHTPLPCVQKYCESLNPFHAVGLFLYPGKHKKTAGFLKFSWGVKRDQWHKIGRWGLHKILLRHAKAAGEKLDTISCLSLKWVSIINSEADCYNMKKSKFLSKSKNNQIFKCVQLQICTVKSHRLWYEFLWWRFFWSEGWLLFNLQLYFYIIYTTASLFYKSLQPPKC